MIIQLGAYLSSHPSVIKYFFGNLDMPGTILDSEYMKTHETILTYVHYFILSLEQPYEGGSTFILT